MNVLARAGVCWLVLACFSITPYVTLFSTQALSLELAGERRFATLAALAIKVFLHSSFLLYFYLIKTF